MNQQLQTLYTYIQESTHLSDVEKSSLLQSIKDIDKELEIALFKLDRTEKVKRTTAILLEETIEELEQKRKAVETQNRELEIEASLERVRSKAMAMHRSEDLAMAVATVFEELDKLSMGILRCGIAILDKEKPRGDIWITVKSEQGNTIQVSGDEPLDIHPLLKGAYDAWLKGEDFSYVLEGVDLSQYYKALNKTNFQLPVSATFDTGENNQKHYYFNAIFQHGSLFAFMKSVITEETKMLMKRFASVFDLTYKRFLDLQKAESQTREAKIEAALEKVRGKAMAMHTSSDLSAAASMVFTELRKLGVNPKRTGVALLKRDSQTALLYTATTSSESDELALIGSLDMSLHPCLVKQYKSWIKKENYFPVLSGEELKSYYKVLSIGLSVPLPTDEEIQHEEYGYYLPFSEGFLYAWGENPYSEDEVNILNRFKAIIDLTFRRYLDLQKAEAQAKEAQIEVALERVRSRTMAMHSSDELAETSSTLFHQLHSLGIETIRTGVGIFDSNNDTVELWLTTVSNELIEKKILGVIPVAIHPVVENYYKAWKQKSPVFYHELSGDEVRHYYETLSSYLDIPIQSAYHPSEIISSFFFPEGSLNVISLSPMTDEEGNIMKRFTSVFGLIYRRFLDLQHAEQQTHKAKIEVAMERVRARALAMQEPEELVDVAQVMRYEMGLLGVEELETSSIYIHDDGSDIADCWYAITDIRSPEKKLVADHITMELHKTWVGRQMIDFYNSIEQRTSIVMQGANRIEWIKYCSGISDVLGDFYGEVIPDRTYQLYKFSNGAIGAASEGDISEESWELLRRATSVFSLAYSRFKDLTQARVDLQKLKTEKQRAEDALSHLKAAQAQLIQSEKMASLGELTAGIAHEIQNPLNFVNNFSEVSNELIDEMKEELATGNKQLAINLADDIKQNLQKINHHGKRADAIVKGMLQHSRTSSGVKEPTDINALADEYFRLAYHGLRAKDKTFNATMKTDYDESLGLINIIPQDIGRVILNLITNAFYAVQEKKAQLSLGYEPTVSVSTKKINDLVELSVKDNGNGIPQKDLDKIFQPFFTTKPTGQGTGLGLSLSYDIVKVHGGELKVETREGEFAEFIIILPI